MNLPPKAVTGERSRRSFIKQSALLGALLTTTPFDALPKQRLSKNSYQIAAPTHRYTPVTIVWDAANLMMKDAGITWKMQDSISEQFNRMVAGRVLDQGQSHLPEILTTIQEGSGWSEAIHPQVALVGGWLVYRESAKVLNAQNISSDQVLQQDVAVLRHRIGSDSSSSASVVDTEGILKLLYHRATFRTHTLTPDTDHWNAWVVNYLDWYRQDRKNMQSLAEAWVAHEKVSPDFFNPEDELIKTASDYSIRQIQLNESFVADKGASLYTQALAQSALALKSLDEFFKGTLSQAEFMKQRGIG